MINFFIKTYGCQANVADSQAIANLLSELNCNEIKTEIDADLIIINTCAIREKAEHKVYSYIGKLLKSRGKSPYFKIVVIGCIASYRKKEFYYRFPQINFVAGSRDNKQFLRDKLIDIVLSLQTSKQVLFVKKTIKTKLSKFNLTLGGIKKESKHSKQSFVNIMTGCNNMCSYCIVPFTRGKEISYSMSSILEKIRADINFGAKEIILLGQNVNSYKDSEKGFNFAQLLEAVALIPGNFWIKFMSPNPKDMTLDVIKVMAKYREKLCPFIHHPLQSGSNKILKDMNRNYDIEKYLEQIKWIRKYLPKATISTDIIVGFPGETEDDFLKTMEIIERVKFDRIFSFIYSPRKYTKAALLPDRLSYNEKQQRLDKLQKCQIDISKDKNLAYVGEILKCLVEKHATNGMLLARSGGNHTVLFNGDDVLIDTFVNIKVISAGAANLIGELV